MAKRVLFLARYLSPPLGGGEFFILSILKDLKSRGYDCLGACYFNPGINAPFHQENFIFWDNIPIFQIRMKNVQDIKDIYDDFKPDIVITQSYDAPIIVRIAKEMGIKTICGTHFWRNICSVKNNFINMLERPLDTVQLLPQNHVVFHEADKVYVNSKFMQNGVKRFVGIEVENIIQPMLDEKRVLSKNRKPEYITLINSDYYKGGMVFANLAKLFPQEKFLCVGLGSEITEENKRTNEEIKRISNIRVIEKTDNMADDVYGKTKILLIPSLVDETFSMVALEGMVNGIPVLASPNGNLRYLIEEGGHILDPDYLSDWEVAIRELLVNDKLYNELSNGAKINASKYNAKNELDKFYNLVNSLIGT